MSNESETNIQIRLIQVEEKSFKYDLSEVLLTTFDENNLKINIGYKLLPDLNANIIAVEITAKYLYSDSELIEYTSSLTFKSPDLSDIIEITDNKIIEKTVIIPTLLNVAIGTLRGMLAIKTTGTILKDFPLPLIDPNSLLGWKA